ncbi:MAG: MFS transporter [Myxococcota bacterium]
MKFIINMESTLMESKSPDRSPAGARSGLFSGERAFSAIVSGQLLSSIGSGMTRFGLGIWVFETTRDVEAFSTLLFFAVLPLGLGSLVAGPIVDRLDRKRLMIVANAAASTSTLAVALLYFGNALELWHLYVALFLNGVANAFILPALESSVPLMVPKDRLERAAGLVQMVQGLEAVLAPALAGLLVGAGGLGAIFVVDFVTFGASVLALLASAVPRPPAMAGPAGLWAEFWFGIQYIVERPAFLYLMGLVTWTMLLLPGFGYALVTPMVLTFSTEEAAGLIVSAFGVGSILGGIGLATWGGPQRTMHGIIGALGLAGGATMVVGLREDPWLIAGAFVVVGAAFIFAVGLNRVLWQRKAAPEVLGRIFSLRVALGVGAQSIGVLCAGVLAERVLEPWLAEGGWLAPSIGQLIGTGEGRGMAFAYLILGGLLVVTAVISALLPAVRKLEDRIPDHVPDPNLEAR